MRFAHLADTHLGYRQYGLIERENDFYEVFARNIDKIIEQDVDFVIHSGDLFEVSKPSTEALYAFQKAFKRLTEEKIPVYAIAGNHDSTLRKGSLPPQILFKDSGLNLISPDSPAYQHGGVLICGLPFVSKSKKNVLLNALSKFSKVADKSLKSILVLHQGIDKFLSSPEAAELSIGDLPTNFDYYAMGHIHSYINESFGKGKLVYPGSMEIWRFNEYNNYLKFGKGFCVVDITPEVPIVERVSIDLPRQFFKEVIEYKELPEKLNLMNKKIKELDKKPIVELTVQNGDFNGSNVYNIIQEYLEDSVLNLRPTFKPDKILDEENLVNDDNLDLRTIVYKEINEKYGKKEINDLSLDLLDTLSLGKIDDAQVISDDFYTKYYFKDSNLLDKSQSVLETEDRTNLDGTKFNQSNNSNNHVNLNEPMESRRFNKSNKSEDFDEIKESEESNVTGERSKSISLDDF